MKPNHLFVGVAALSVLMFAMLAVLFSQHAGLEQELSALRALVAKSGNSDERASFGSSTETSSPAPGPTRVGRVEPIADGELLDAARARIAELENVLNGQADVLEKLMAEANAREEARRKASMRSWGEEQATGAPDTMTAGDRSSAWAPSVADGGVEWLEAEFENAADLAKIVVRQTCNPGGITRVVAIADNGAEIPIWAGEDPSKGQQLADTPFSVNGGVHAKRVRVYVDTSKLSGWEEIDAVQITGRDGASQWAKSSKASSSYATRTGTRLGGLENSTQLLLQSKDSF